MTVPIVSVGALAEAERLVLRDLKYYCIVPLHMSDEQAGTTVAVTSKGQATIPKEFRDKLHIDTPGRVRFVENEDGEIVVRPVKRPPEIRGALASEDEEEKRETSATERLRAERERDEMEIDATYDPSEREE
ncbi:MAG: AbrB/MazE/SpoVT family DNA-binding domain-containing protein [Haloarculaceae archaeon]